MTPPLISRHFPPAQADRLIRAAAVLSGAALRDEIDRIADELVALGKCRPRSCTALDERWARERRAMQPLGWGG